MFVQRLRRRTSRWCPARRGRRTARCRTERAYSGGPLGPMDAASPVVTPRSASPQPLAAGPCTQAWLGWLPGRTGPWSVRPVCDLAGTCGLLPGTTIASNSCRFLFVRTCRAPPASCPCPHPALAPFVASLGLQVCSLIPCRRAHSNLTRTNQTESAVRKAGGRAASGGRIVVLCTKRLTVTVPKTTLGHFSDALQTPVLLEPTSYVPV